LLSEHVVPSSLGKPKLCDRHTGDLDHFALAEEGEPAIFEQRLGRSVKLDLARTKTFQKR
jgi:hypothetical protein